MTGSNKFSEKKSSYKNFDCCLFSKYCKLDVNNHVLYINIIIAVLVMFCLYIVLYDWFFFCCWIFYHLYVSKFSVTSISSELVYIAYFKGQAETWLRVWNIARYKTHWWHCFFLLLLGRVIVPLTQSLLQFSILLLEIHSKLIFVLFCPWIHLHTFSISLIMIL